MDNNMDFLLSLNINVAFYKIWDFHKKNYIKIFLVNIFIIGANIINKVYPYYQNKLLVSFFVHKIMLSKTMNEKSKTKTV